MKRLLLSLALCCSMNAMAQQIISEQNTIDCGQIVYRDATSVEYRLRNNSERPMHITKVRVSCGCTRVDYPKTAIAPGEKYSVSVQYDAQQLGHFVKHIQILSDTEPEGQLLTLKGVVVSEVTDFKGDYPYMIGDFKADINNIEFDNVNRGDRPMAKIHLFNATDRTLTPVVMHLPPYLKADMSPSTVAPNHGVTATIALNSEKLHDFGLNQTEIYLGGTPGDKVSEEKSISVSAILLPNFEMTEDELLNAPQLQLSHPAFDLGTFGKKKKLKGEIEIYNTGKSALDVRALQIFTTGIEVQLNKHKIAPGEKAKLKVIAIKSGIVTARSKPRVLMITNDPNQPKVIINVNVQ